MDSRNPTTISGISMGQARVPTLFESVDLDGPKIDDGFVEERDKFYRLLHF